MSWMNRIRDSRRGRWERRIAEAMRADAANLGMTLEELEEIEAPGALKEALGVSEVMVVCERLDGGIPMLAQERAYWWIARRLYAVDGDGETAGLPATPAGITGEAVREAIRVCGCASHYFEVDDTEVWVTRRPTFRRLFGWRRGKSDPWADVKRVYLECETYQHTLHGTTDYIFGASSIERCEYWGTLYFQRPDRVAVDWKYSMTQHSESGWIRALGPHVRYYSTRDGRVLDGFTLHGAIYRACGGHRDERQTVALLLPHEVDFWVDEEGCRREDSEAFGDAACYRLIRGSESTIRRANGGKEASRFSSTTWVDASRHAIVRTETIYECKEGGSVGRCEFEPRFNDAIPESVWEAPMCGGRE